ncbi:MAG: NFACT family protein, partial [Blautia sp.]
MAFDGITIAAMVKELRQHLVGGRINKIAQPEADELLLTCRGPLGNCRLLLSASASLPLIYFTDKNKPSPLTAPNFCMLLRKHLSSARFLSITQPGLERVIQFQLEHLNELGDPCRKYLIVEIMGKHSNIIFCDDNKKILDSIKHVSSNMSSIREVLPGRDYFLPQTQRKLDPLTVTAEDFQRDVLATPLPTSKALYTALTGISPTMARELCARAAIDGDASAENLDDNAKIRLYSTLQRLMEETQEGGFSPNILFQDGLPVEYGVFPMVQYQDICTEKEYATVSQMLEQYYAQKNILTHIRQKSSDLRKIVQTALDRNYKKYAIQQKQLKDTEKKDKYKVYGELINAYGYGLEDGCKSFQALNYYTNEEITIPLDPTLSPKENAKKYFDRYAKLKRTEEALTVQIAETNAEISHLESISASLDIARKEEDLTQIKEELIQYGYIKRHASGKKKFSAKSRPFHYIS